MQDDIMIASKCRATDKNWIDITRQCSNYLKLIIIFETENTFMERPHRTNVVNFPHDLCPSDIILEMVVQANALNDGAYYPISNSISMPERPGLYQSL